MDELKRMDCERVRDILPELLDGRLSDADAAQARTHLERCTECQVEAEVAASIRRARLAVPAGLEAQIRLRLRARPVVFWRRPAVMAAGLALALAGGSLLMVRGPASAPVELDDRSLGWFSVDDAFLSGAASLGDLSDEELENLLVELDS